MQFTLKHLRYFVAAADAASVTAAARAINVSQPSISAAIAHLEAVFGLQLFIRHHAQGLSLTPAGRQFLVEARALLAQAADLRQSAIGLGDKLAGEIDVGCFITFAPLLIPGLLRGFSARYPETRIRLHENHIQALLDGLRAGRFDLAVTYDLNLGADLNFDPLAEVPLHVILPASHRLAKSPTVSLAELIEEPLVLLALPQSRDYFLSVFYGLRLQPRIAHETPSFEMVRGLVANGHGYSIMHSRPASDMSLDGVRLVYRPVTEKLRPTRLGIARLESARPRRMATAFGEFCRQYLSTGGLALAPL
ncbi:MAG: LysR substrate-binding domain-containing protein, partial [Dongiaceae bacterium]